MKVTLIQPSIPNGHTWECYNIGLLKAYASSRLKNKEVTWSFYSHFYDDTNDIIKGASDSDIVGFSCTTPQLKDALYLKDEIKKNNSEVRFIFGGIGSTLEAELNKTDNKNLTNTIFEGDCVVLREGERTFFRILNRFQNTGNFPNNKVCFSTYIDNLDTIPFTDRDFIKNERNINQAYKDEKRRVTSIIESRGCKHNCVFCSSKYQWGQCTRFRSPMNVVTEMSQLVTNWDIDFIKFGSDTFALDHDWLRKFVAYKNALGINTPFGCNLHASLFKRLELLKEGNCEEVYIGVESGSPKILKQMKKGISIKMVKTIFREAKKLGIKTRAYFLLGMPNESEKDIQMTRNLAKAIDADMVGFAIYAPYPFTSIYNDYKDLDIDWSLMDEYGNPYTRTKYLTNEELLHYRKELCDEFDKNLVIRSKDR